MAQWSVSEIPDQSGRTVLVTGANSGLGLHTSIALARKGARVLMASRNATKAAEALARVQTDAPGAKAEVVPLDLASLDSVRAAADDVATRTSQLDVLYANAGVMAIPRAQTADGFEMQFGTNHLGHFALTGLLAPLLLGGDDPRVVVVASDAHKIGRIRFEDLQGEKSYGRWSAYGQSKLANLLFMRELDRRGAGRLKAVGAHPGYAATNLQSNYGNPVVDLFMRIGNRVIAQSDEAGAWPQLYAGTMPDVQGGEYFGPSGVFGLRGSPDRDTPTRSAQDSEVAARLWDVSEQLTGVSFPP